MNIDDIQAKYMTALSAITADGGWVEWPAVRLALRLAIADGYAAGGALADDLAAIVASQAQAKPEPGPDQRVVEHAFNQIARLNEWLEQHRHDLYWEGDLDTAQAVLAALASLQAEREALRQQMVQMDADEAGLRRQLVELPREVDRLTRQNVIATDTFNSLAHTNGAAAVGHVSNVTEPRVDWWADLDEETNDYRISLDAGRRKFREVPKPARLLLAQAVARNIGGGALPKQADFDFFKPAWMPGGAGLAVTFGCNWSELLTITPAEVAP